MTSLVVGFSFADLFDVNYITGKIVNNRNPTIVLGAPSDGQVVGNPATFTWTYFDPEDDPMEEYALLIDDNMRFSSPIAYYGLKGDSEKQYLPLEDGLYYWRVEIKNKFGTGVSEVRAFYLNNKEKLCGDGTKYYECSNKKPDYCRAGVLVKDCIKCGCESGGICGKGGDCNELKCSDGTRYGECSSSKPKLCLNTGVLKDTCSLCGCPNDLECDSTGSCEEKVVEQVIEQEEVIKNVPEKGFISILKRVAKIFKFLFTGQPL